jgi:hypothetical protein
MDLEHDVSETGIYLRHQVKPILLGSIDRPCPCLRSGDSNFINFNEYITDRSRVSSGSIVSDYGLDDRAIEVRSPAGAKDFSSSLCIQTGSGVHPASCTMGTGGPFPGDKARPGRDADHSPPSSAVVVNE